MHAICLLLLLLLLPLHETQSQNSRPAKIQLIVQIQDQRRGDDPRLQAILSDSDAVVREQAVLAYANIQDTLLLPKLLERLRDSSTTVREAAAFAIGQTGSLLSPSGRAALEGECLDACMRKGAPPRLVEEIGKFGTVASLSQLAELAASKLTEAQREALIMGIARFAIRGIVSENATRYLVGLAEMSPYVSWKTVYALQRIAPHVSVENNVLLPLAAHPDPLVRMNAATLAGKIPTSLITSALLARLSSEDPDWRVRVNATKAMGSPGAAPAAVVMSQFTHAFSDSNEHVALSAMSTFGEMMKGAGKIPESAEMELWMIAENRNSTASVGRQAEAATALAKVERSAAFSRLARIRPSSEWLRARYLIALGFTGDSVALTALSEGIQSKDPLVASSSLEGLQHLVELNPRNHRLTKAATAYILHSLSSPDVSVLSTAASMLTDSLLSDPAAAPKLLKALDRLHEPDDTEAIQQILQTLGALRDTGAVPALRRHLSSSDRTVAEAAANALEQITGRSYRANIHVALKPESDSGDSAFLAKLGSVVLVRMQTSAGAVLLELYPRTAPHTVMSFVRLCARKFYDGLRFHRVVANFVVQGGDPRGDGWGGPGYSIRSEFSLLRYERGMIGMASAGKDTEGSQFFITHSPQPHLDGRYAIFGRVREGMDVVDRLQVGDIIEQMSVETEGIVGK